MAPSTPPKVLESWLLSAAASLQKSLPPISAKKSPFKSAKKIKGLTPRQSKSKEVTRTCPNFSVSAVCDLVISLPIDISREDVLQAEDTVEEVEAAVVVVEEVAVEVEGASVKIEEAVALVEEAAVVMEKDVVVIDEVILVVEDAAVAVAEDVVVIDEVTVVVEEVAVKVEESVALVEEVKVEEIEVEVEEAIAQVEEDAVVVKKGVVVIDEVTLVVEEAVVFVEEVIVAVEEVAVEVEEVTEVVEEVAMKVEEVAVEVEEVTEMVEEVDVKVEEAVMVTKVMSEKGAVPTPARSTRSKVSTPSIPLQSEDLSVKKTRSTRKASAHAPVPTPIAAAVAVATESVFDLEKVAESAAEGMITAEPEISTVTKGRQKRGVTADVISTTKRARRGQASDPDNTMAESSSIVPNMIDFADQVEEVREDIPIVDPTPSRSTGKVLRSLKKTPLIPEVPIEGEKVVRKGKGKATKGVKQAIELEEGDEGEDEEEEEEALALLCDG